MTPADRWAQRVRFAMHKLKIARNQQEAATRLVKEAETELRSALQAVTKPAQKESA